MVLVDDRIVEQRVEVALLGLGDVIAIVENVADNGDLRSIASRVPARDRAGGAQGRMHWIHVSVHEDIALDPGVGAIEVENVIGSAKEDVVVVLDDRLTQVAIAAGIIHNVIVAAGRAEETLANDTVTAALNPGRAMHQLESRGGGREDATAENERSSIERKILVRCGAERRVVKRKRARRHINARRAIALKISVSDACLRRTDPAVDG